MINLILYLTVGLGLGLLFYMIDNKSNEEDKIQHLGLITLFFPIMLPYFVYKKIKKII